MEVSEGFEGLNVDRLFGRGLLCEVLRRSRGGVIIGRRCLLAGWLWRRGREGRR